MVNRILTALLSLAFVQALQADPLDYWILTHSRTNGYPKLGAFGNGRYVVAVQGTDGGINALWTSGDGTNWWSTFESPITGLIFGNGLFVAAYADLYVISSSDGEAWVTRRLPVAGGTGVVKAALGGFWTLAQQGASATLLTSRDALEWVPALTNAPARGILLGDEDMLVLGGDPPIATSNGVDFTPLPSLPQFSSLERIGHTWVGIEAVNPENNIAVSTNGTDWTRFRPSPFFNEYWCVSKMNDRFALISHGRRTYFFESADGFKWIDHDVGLRFRIADLVFGRDTILALASQQLDTPKPGIFTTAGRILRSRPLTPTAAAPLSSSLRPSLSERIPCGSIGPFNTRGRTGATAAPDEATRRTSRSVLESG